LTGTERRYENLTEKQGKSKLSMDSIIRGQTLTACVSLEEEEEEEEED
jgi:hypothetical protein